MDSKLFSSNQVSAVFAYYLLEQNGVKIYPQHAKNKAFQITFRTGVRDIVSWINTFSWQDSEEGYLYWISLVIKTGYHPKDHVETTRFLDHKRHLPFPPAVEMFFY